MNDAHDNVETDRGMLGRFNSAHAVSYAKSLETLIRIRRLIDAQQCALCGHPRSEHGISFSESFRTTKCYTEITHECSKCQVGQTKPFGPGCDCEEVMCDCPGFEDAPEEPPADEDDRDPYEGEVLLW